MLVCLDPHHSVDLSSLWYSSKAKDKKGQEREEVRICERVAVANLGGLQERWRLSTPVGDNRKPVWHLLMLVVHTASGKLCETAYIFITASFKTVDSSRISAIFGFHEENQKRFLPWSSSKQSKNMSNKINRTWPIFTYSTQVYSGQRKVWQLCASPSIWSNCSLSSYYLLTLLMLCLGDVTVSWDSCIYHNCFSQPALCVVGWSASACQCGISIPTRPSLCCVYLFHK